MGAIRKIRQVLKFRWTAHLCLPASRGAELRAHSDAESGDTLVEVLIALTVIALTVTALLAAFATAVTASGEQSGLALTDTVLKSYVEAANFQIENQPYSSANNTYPIFAACGTASTSYYDSGIGSGVGNNNVPLYTPPAGYSAHITDLQYWSTTTSPPSFLSTCTPGSSSALNPQQLTATVTAPNGTQGTLTFVVSNPQVPVGAASQMVFLPQPKSSETAATAFDIGVVLEDSLGHVRTNDSSSSVTLSITGGTGSPGAVLSCSSNPVTASSGVASFSCSINKSGANYTLTATSPGYTATISSPFTVNPGAASKIAFVPATPGGGGAVAGSHIPSVSVQVEDSSGNVVTNLASGSIVMSLGAGDPQSSFDPGSTTTVALSNGVANFSSPGFLQLTNFGNYTFIATPSGIAGVSTPISASVSVAPGASTILLVFTAQPGGGPNGQVWSGQPQVTIENGLGQVQTSNTTPVSLSIFSSPGSGGTLSCPIFGTSIPPTNGVASFAGCFIVGSAGSYVLSASASGIGTFQSAPFSITTGSASKLVYNPAPVGNVKKNKSFQTQPIVQVEDSGGNLVNSTAAVTLSLAGAPTATITCAVNPVNASAGTATFNNCSINTAGTYQVKASSTGLASVTASVTITN
jgi:hypothetical protein